MKKEGTWTPWCAREDNIKIYLEWDNIHLTPDGLL